MSKCAKLFAPLNSKPHFFFNWTKQYEKKNIKPLKKLAKRSHDQCFTHLLHATVIGTKCLSSHHPSPPFSDVWRIHQVFGWACWKIETHTSSGVSKITRKIWIPTSFVCALRLVFTEELDLLKNHQSLYFSPSLSFNTWVLTRHQEIFCEALEKSYLRMGMLRLFPAAMCGALMLWQKRIKVMSR